MALSSWNHWVLGSLSRDSRTRNRTWNCNDRNHEFHIPRTHDRTPNKSWTTCRRDFDSQKLLGRHLSFEQFSRFNSTSLGGYSIKDENSSIAVPSKHNCSILRVILGAVMRFEHPERKINLRDFDWIPIGRLMRLLQFLRFKVTSELTFWIDGGVISNKLLQSSRINLSSFRACERSGIFSRLLEKLRSKHFKFARFCLKKNRWKCI